MDIRKITVPQDAEPARIDSFLAGELPEMSRSQIKQLILDASVTCRGGAVKPSSKVGAGDEITVEIPEPVEPDILPENIPLDILYQDGDIAVVNKQAGLAVHPAGRIVSGTLVNALLYHIKDLSGINGVLRPGIVHRLDKDTTGVMVIAKNDASHRSIAAQFESRTTRKSYTALVWGIFDSQNGEIEKSIARSRSDRKKMVSGTRGKQSKTLYSIIKEFEFLTLVNAHPRTGRTHQIRSHFSSIGHPVFGDELYRGRNRRLSGLTVPERSFAVRLLKNFRRQALHAAELSFEHPSTHERVEFSAPLPEDFRHLLNELEIDAESSTV